MTATHNNEILPSGYSVLHKDRGTRGGGVMIACAASLPVTHLPKPAPHLELISVQINLSPTTVILSVLYIPPSATIQYFPDTIDHLHHLFLSHKFPSFVIGDFNCPD